MEIIAAILRFAHRSNVVAFQARRVGQFLMLVLNPQRPKSQDWKVDWHAAKYMVILHDRLARERPPSREMIDPEFEENS
jgi:hypothetical protein